MNLQQQQNWCSFQQFFKVQTPTVIDSKPIRRKSSTNKVRHNESGVRIFARFRPLSTNETDSCCLESVYERMVMVQGTPFVFDQVFQAKDTQQEIFEAVAMKIADDAINGISGTVLAYGQTGSGKTYTMLGVQGQEGIIHRTAKYLLQNTSQLTVSVLEVHKEVINDLLGGLKDLKLKEDTQSGVFVDKLSSVVITNEEQFQQLISFAQENRHVSETRLNLSSSRSHLLVQITTSAGRINLVDLAGSEKVSKTGARGETLEEAKKINFSLSCLGHVVQCLALGNEHVPYRDSKLTRLLQESLQGINTRTTLIVTCSPHSASVDETVSSLKFAQRAKMMKARTPECKRTITPQDELVQLKEELQETKSQLLMAVQNQSCLQSQVNQLEEVKTPMSKNDEISPNKSSRSTFQLSRSNIRINEIPQITECPQQICSLEAFVYEVQGKLSYFLSGFSQFIREFSQTTQARVLTQQLLDLNQAFQSMSVLVRAEESRFLSQQILLDESKTVSALLKRALNEGRVTMGQQQPENYRVDHILNQLAAEEAELDYAYRTPIGHVTLRSEDGEPLREKENHNPILQVKSLNRSRTNITPIKNISSLRQTKTNLNQSKTKK